ncbi:MAG: iron dependent repressor, metal binding and dimerization domain protein [Planctomycetaceae bacterium]
MTRNHRLWEEYLQQYADAAPGHVHNDADLIEHVLDAELVTELERLVNARTQRLPTERGS